MTCSWFPQTLCAQLDFGVQRAAVEKKKKYLETTSKSPCNG
jgi:hypothetical protein